MWCAALSMWVMMTPIFLFRFLPWPGQVAACVLAVIVGRWIAGKGRALVVTTAPPVPDAADLAAAEATVAERTTALAGAPAMHAAGSQGLRDIARRYRSTGRWQPAGDPEADRTALLAGQAFRVVAWRRVGGRWRSGQLRIGSQPLTLSWATGRPSQA